MPKAGRGPVIRKLCQTPRWSPTSREVHGGISPDVRDKVFDKSSLHRPEYSDVGGRVKTTENNGRPIN
ncbi:hypothetical protein K438DRAFT_1875065, partial [Mycena galopus ATCC 62051]